MYQGVFPSPALRQVYNPADVRQHVGAPSTVFDSTIKLGTISIDYQNEVAYILVANSGGVLTWGEFGSGAGTGFVETINSLSPVAGNIIIAGTTSEVSVANAGHTVTLSVPSTFIAPGSIAATTSITATLGNITATSGNLVVTAAADGLVFTNAAATAGTTTATLNGRVGQVTITTPSIAGGATFGMTITNSAITGSTTQVMYALSGGTTGAALSIQSYANTAGQSVVTINNGTGATTNSASLILNFIVLN